MFKFIIILFASLLIAETKQPTQVNKDLIKEELKQALLKYKYNGEEAKMTNLYLNNNEITYEMNVNYADYVNKNSISKMGENPVLKDKKLKKINSIYTALTMRQELRKNLCSDSQIRTILKEGFIYKFIYKWDNDETPFLIKTVNENECLDFFKKESK